MAKKTATAAEGKSAYTIALELAEIRSEMAVLRQAEKSVSEDLRKRMAAGEEQDLFKFTTTTQLKIVDAKKVLAWATKVAPQIITVNTTLARKVFLSDALTGKLGTPEKAGFALNEVEQLREVRAKGDGPESGYDVA